MLSCESCLSFPYVSCIRLYMSLYVVVCRSMSDHVCIVFLCVVKGLYVSCHGTLPLKNCEDPDPRASWNETVLASAVPRLCQAKQSCQARYYHSRMGPSLVTHHLFDNGFALWYVKLFYRGCSRFLLKTMRIPAVGCPRRRGRDPTAPMALQREAAQRGASAAPLKLAGAFVLPRSFEA